MATEPNYLSLRRWRFNSEAGIDIVKAMVSCGSGLARSGGTIDTGRPGPPRINFQGVTWYGLARCWSPSPD